MKSNEIEDNMFDIHKLQKQKKYENKGKINELSIDGKVFTGTTQILEGLQEKLVEDLGQGTQVNDEPPSQDEKQFLELLPKLDINDDERGRIMGPVTEEECEEIFKEVDMDSSPGNDGITYRMMRHLYRQNLFYKVLYLELQNDY